MPGYCVLCHTVYTDREGGDSCPKHQFAGLFGMADPDLYNLMLWQLVGEKLEVVEAKTSHAYALSGAGEVEADTKPEEVREYLSQHPICHKKSNESNTRIEVMHLEFPGGAK